MMSEGGARAVAQTRKNTTLALDLAGLFPGFTP